MLTYRPAHKRHNKGNTTMPNKTKTKTATPIAALAAALTAATKLTPKRASAPIMTCVRVTLSPRVSSTTVTVEATDCDTWTVETVDTLPYAAPVAGTQSVVVDARDAAAAARAAAKLNDARVAIETTTDGARVLRIGPMLIPAPMDASDYQPAPKLDAASAVVVDAPLLPDAIAAVRPCVSTEATRYYLCGVALRSRAAVNGSRITTMDVVATDGHRLARYEAGAVIYCDNTAEPPAPVDVVIPMGALDALSGAVALRTDGRLVAASIGARYVVARLIEGTFPPYERVIPSKESTVRTTVTSSRVDVDALSAAAASAVSMGGKGARITWEGETITLQGDLAAVLPALGAPAPGALKISFSAAYIKAIAGSFTAPGADTTHGSVTCYASDAASPILLERGRLQYVVMPMRIK